MQNKKRGQAGEITLLILLLAVFLVIYLIVLPTKEKCKILGDLPECKGISLNNQLEKSEQIVELRVNPGLISPQERFLIYYIDGGALYSKNVVEFPVELPYFTLENKWGDEQVIEQEFFAYNSSKTELLINLLKSKGTLKVYLNEKYIGGVSGEGVKILSINPEVGLNKIKLIVSEPWIPVTNRIEIGFLKIKQHYILSINNLERIVSIQNNLSEVKHARLNLWLDCLSEDSVKIEFNNETLMNEKGCGERIFSIKGYLREENVFRVSSPGNYNIHDIKIEIEMQEKDYPEYHFLISEKDYEKIRKGYRLPLLRFGFDDKSSKNLMVLINGRNLSINTNNIEYQTNVAGYLKEGYNIIKLIPIKPANVVFMELVY